MKSTTTLILLVALFAATIPTTSALSRHGSIFPNAPSKLIFKEQTLNRRSRHALRDDQLSTQEELATPRRMVSGASTTTEMNRGSADENIGMFNKATRIAYLVIGWLGILDNGVVLLVLLCSHAERRTFTNIVIMNQSMIVSISKL